MLKLGLLQVTSLVSERSKKEEECLQLAKQHVY